MRSVTSNSALLAGWLAIGVVAPSQFASSQPTRSRPARSSPASTPVPGRQSAQAQSAQLDEAGSALSLIEGALVDAIARVQDSVVAIARITPRADSLILGGFEDPFAELRPDGRSSPEPQAYATGVIIDSAGLILTQYVNVAANDLHTVITSRGERYQATIKAADPRSGLAVLQVPAEGLPAIALGNAEGLRRGQLVVTVGNPYAIARDGAPSASWGIVSNLAQRAAAEAVLGDAGSRQSTLHHFGTLIQTDARLNFQAGGGPLIDLRGNMVGLITSVATIAGHERPAGYAIPMNRVFRRIIDQLKEGREVEYGLLGISFSARPSPRFSARGREAAQADAPRGIVIGQVYPGSPAARAGLQVGDLITHVDGQEVPDSDRLQLTVGTLPPSQRVIVRYQRRGQPQMTQVALAKFAVTGQQIVTQRPPPWRGIHVDYATAVIQREPRNRAIAEAIDPEGCVLVKDVVPDSAAWRAGVRPGAFISHVAGERVTSPAEFRTAVRIAAESDDAVIDVRFTKPLVTPRQNGGPADRPQDVRLPL